MPVFRVSGSTGQAPTTSFFGAIPDQFNMLVPAHIPAGDTVISWDNMIAANNINQWTGFNITLGATTTAPDGTSNAQKIVETSANAGHYLTAYPNKSGTGYAFGSTYRLAVFAKAAERTRIALAAGSSGLADTGFITGSSIASGCYTVFDLAGGQIGVANTKFGADTTWVPLATTILSFGNGWYLCQMDFVAGFNSAGQNFIITAVAVDAGSGTGAKNVSYAGNTSDGVYTWRSTMLPPGAWDQFSGQTVFFDDFNDPTLANVDQANTKAPGFDWYVDNNFPFKSGSYPAPFAPGALTASGSILHLPPHAYGGFPANSAVLTTACWNGSAVIGTRLFHAPMIWDFSVAYNNFNQPFPDDAAIWSVALESELSARKDIIYGEIDPLETVNFVLMSQSTIWSGNFGSPAPPTPSENDFQPTLVGIPIWYNAIRYSTNGMFSGDVVFFNGVLYTSLQNPNQGNQPDISPTFWSVFDPTTIKAPAANKCRQFTYDSFQHIQMVWIRVQGTQSGHFMVFSNGVLAGVAANYGINNPIWINETGATFRVLIETGRSMGLDVDYIKVIK